MTRNAVNLRRITEDANSSRRTEKLKLQQKISDFYWRYADDEFVTVNEEIHLTLFTSNQNLIDRKDENKLDILLRYLFF